MSPRVLVAGIGNIFLADDGFGVEVARRLREVDLPGQVQVGDYGTSGMHLAFDLLDGYDTAILVDATPRGEPPGTLSVLQPSDTGRRGSAQLDAHGMQPDAVLALLEQLGGVAPRVLVLGCEPAETERRIGLSAPVERAVAGAVRKVVQLVEREGRPRQQTA